LDGKNRVLFFRKPETAGRTRRVGFQAECGAAAPIVAVITP
jgi:hypothetical protein